MLMLQAFGRTFEGHSLDDILREIAALDVEESEAPAMMLGPFTEAAVVYWGVVRKVQDRYVFVEHSRSQPPNQREYWVLHSPYPDGTWRGLEKCLSPEHESLLIFESVVAAQRYIEKHDLINVQPVPVVLQHPHIRGVL